MSDFSQRVVGFVNEFYNGNKRNPILSWKVSHPSSEKYDSMGLGGNRIEPAISCNS
jgi:hypothetical protein